MNLSTDRRFDAAGLAKLPAALQGFVDRGELSGSVSMTWRAGDIIQADAVGYRNLDDRSPMTMDTLFRIASMTKPITSVAVMILVEEGRLRLDDPVTQWAPELADVQVLRQADAPLDDTLAPARTMTIEDLLTHRSGVTSGLFSAGPIGVAYRETLGDGISNEKTPTQWLQALGTLPLIYQPGQRMQYGQSTDVLGFIIERIEGKPFAEVLSDRIFKPLGMKDTGFSILPEQISRLATMYRFDDDLDALSPAPPPASLTGDWSFRSGAAGLISTAGDYLIFARMLLGGGTLNGVRLLRSQSVLDMRANRLTREQRQIPFLGVPVWDGMGFGLGLGVVDDPEKNLLGCGGIGSFTWPGAYGTWWQADPTQDLIMVHMVQHLLPMTPDAGALIAASKGMAGRGALSVFQKTIYDSIAPI